MSSEQQTIDRLREQAVAASAKLTYFISGLAASALAFAFHETSDWGLSPSLWFVAAAGAAWAASVGSGIFFADANIRLANIDHLTAFASFDASKTAALPILNEKQRKWASRARRWYAAQTTLLLLGVALYAIGHVAHLMVKAQSTGRQAATAAIPAAAPPASRASRASHAYPAASG